MAKPIASPAVTLTPEALQAVIAQAIAEHDARKAHQERADTSADMDRLCIRAFVKAGYKPETIQPRQNILTFNKWLEQGLRVKPGEHAIKVKNLRLFHRDQVEAMNAADKKEAMANLAAKRAARTADRLPKVSPVEVPKAQLVPTPPRKSAKVLIAEPGKA